MPSQASAVEGGKFRVDQQTIEVRAYAVAREFTPLLVNTAVALSGQNTCSLAHHDVVFCRKRLGVLRRLSSSDGWAIPASPTAPW
jgi:ethanolamine ammonia-lyase large subunit